MSFKKVTKKEWLAKGLQKGSLKQLRTLDLFMN